MILHRTWWQHAHVKPLRLRRYPQQSDRVFAYRLVSSALVGSARLRETSILVHQDRTGRRWRLKSQRRLLWPTKSSCGFGYLLQQAGWLQKGLHCSKSLNQNDGWWQGWMPTYRDNKRWKSGLWASHKEVWRLLQYTYRKRLLANASTFPSGCSLMSQWRIPLSTGFECGSRPSRG
jgi:hypothetical protein